MADRRIIYRWLAGGLLWLLIIIVVIISIRSVNIVSRTGSVAASAMTSQQEILLTDVRETTRAFSLEWGTWGSSPEDYRDRLSRFIKDSDSILAPDGIQEVIASFIKNIKKEGDIYRVRLTLHTRRLVPVPYPEARSLPGVLAPVTRENLSDLQQDSYANQQDAPVLVWQNHIMDIEVPVQVEGGRAIIQGLPIIITNSGEETGTISAHGLTERASSEFMSFIKQFFDLYYSGESLTNFLAPEVDIKPVSGWGLISISEVKVDSEQSPTRAYAKLIISAPGVEKLTQQLYLKIIPADSFLVEDLSASNF